MQFHIILVSPARPENVGAAARAMKTMGFTSLRIVDSDAHLQPAAHWVAHGSTEILDNALCFNTLEEALHDVSFSVASTARSRAHYHYYCSPVELLEQLSEKKQWLSDIAIIFGREDSGLTNEELALADLLTGVPMKADYPSLNLGQAVMVYCYQLADLLIESENKNNITPDQKQFLTLRLRMHQLLEKLNVSDDEKLSQWIQQRLGLCQQRDMVMMHRLLNDIEKKLLPAEPSINSDD
ncbi:tRNA/rRNA methyltransferase [Budvicia aquatica]|uniref:tRNA/rRNA methyltransferase n=1 Tax=Budvicia aquatica TaxID=82979 RepID=UPI001B53B006|nr:tRNA/rRNA methyltransferase [Budvicia aquatica]MBP9642823.1 tRNA/rRNA methyltransferase [Budvicia sp.]GKX50248.1 tRNA (cytidine/uridine-2'-O-)-methyltransferase TrmJ [Budvicia aquatica]